MTGPSSRSPLVAPGRHRAIETCGRAVRGGDDGETGVADARSASCEAAARMAAEGEADRFRAIAERTTDVVGMADAEGRLTYLNPAGRAVLGLGADVDPRGDLITDHLPAAEAARLPEMLGKAAESGSWSGESVLRRRDGIAVPVSLVVIAHRDHRGVIEFYSTVARDLRERIRAEQALHEERERYRTLVAQSPVGIFLADTDGATVFANERAAEIVGRPVAEIRGRVWLEHVHPADRDRVAAGWREAVRSGGSWDAEYRMVTAGGDERRVSSSARPLCDPHGAPVGYLGTSIDVTEQRDLERERRRSTAEQAAREVSDAAAARLQALVDGLAAIVWEADAATMRFTFVSDRAVDLLGHPVRDWLDDPGFWPGIIHPDDRADAVAFCAAETAAGRDHDLSYRAVTADGRVVWLHDVVHLVRDAGGVVRSLQGVMIDITEQKRAERAAELLAEAGRVLMGAGAPEHRLAALARLAREDFGELAVVSMTDADGMFRRVAVAHPDPAVEKAVTRIAPTRLPGPLADTLRAGHPLVLELTPDLIRGVARDPADAAVRAAVGARHALTVPLVANGALLGVLGFLSAAPRRHSAADLALAEELGRRAATVLAAERAHHRERQLRQVSTDLASAGTGAGAARRLADRLADAVGSSAFSVYLLDEPHLNLVHAAGYPDEILESFRRMRVDDPTPLAETARTGEPIWLGDRAEWESRYPHLVDHTAATGNHAAAALPLRTGERIVGVLGLSFATPREFAADEREFVLALVAQAAPAFERAAIADERRHVAETLQRSLLPRRLPRLPGVEFATHYLPAAAGLAAGGDWFDVLPLDGHRAAVVVGDVVGHGAAAAAVMGQLRSALAAYLIEGHHPASAMDRLDVFARTVDGAAGSTALGLILDLRGGELCWSRAGHPLPLLADSRGVRYLEGGGGTVLGVRGRPPARQGVTRLEPGATVVLYTDGLVERRDEVLDEGLDRLATNLADLRGRPVDAVAAGLLRRCLREPGPHDDVALVVARWSPA